MTEKKQFIFQALYL